MCQQPIDQLTPSHSGARLARILFSVTFASPSRALPEATPSNGPGEVVVFPASLGCLPCVVDSHGEYVPLFHIFAVFEENTDFGDVCEHLPDLSAGTVHWVSEFIYRALQANVLGLDLEPLIESFGHGPQLLEAIARLTRDWEPPSRYYVEVAEEYVFHGYTHAVAEAPLTFLHSTGTK